MKHKITLRSWFILACLGLLLVAIMKPKSWTVVKADCTPGRSVDRSFWFEVAQQLQNPPPTSEYAFTIEALEKWKPFENTGACWNPLATTWSMPGSTNYNSVGVKNYPDKNTGTRATANTLNLSYYNAIRNMLARRSFNRTAITQALNTWTGNGAYVNTLVSQWEALYNNWPTTQVRSRHSGLCLDIQNWSVSNGGYTQQWGCSGGNNQKWYLKRVGSYYLIIARHSGKCLDVQNWSTNNGARIIQWDCHGGNNQQWSITSVGGGYYKLISRYSGKCLDVQNWATGNGGLIIQYTCGNNQANQQWSLTIP